MKLFCAAGLAVLLVCTQAQAQEHPRKKPHTSAAKKSKPETGASCKAPAVAPCSSCAITCRPGETASCAPAQVSADMCVTQASCKCAVR
jgi:hypothetical protein